MKNLNHQVYTRNVLLSQQHQSKPNSLIERVYISTDVIMHTVVRLRKID